MTDKLTKTFFDTFGIEPKERKACNSFPCSGKECENCNDYITYKVEYPQITNSILLKLICIANSQNIGFEGNNIEDIKKDLLDNFIFFKRDVYDQVRTIFKETK